MQLTHRLYLQLYALSNRHLHLRAHDRPGFRRSIGSGELIVPLRTGTLDLPVLLC
jgi:hypothetical protein